MYEVQLPSAAVYIVMHSRKQQWTKLTVTRLSLNCTKQNGSGHPEKVVRMHGNSDAAYTSVA